MQNVSVLMSLQLKFDIYKILRQVQASKMFLFSTVYCNSVYPLVLVAA